MSAKNGKVPFNLSMNRELKRQMKIYCAENDSDVSEITEKLYTDFLRRHGKLPLAAESRPTAATKTKSR